MEINMNGVTLKIDYITVLCGNGKWLDNDGELYEIENIKLPMLADGKHIVIRSKEYEDVAENRSYDDGKIIEFECNRVEHWSL